MLRVDALSLNRGGFRLKDLSFELPEGGYAVLLGASGAGKTLLLEALAGLCPITQGQIRLDGERLESHPPQRRPISLVYQDQALFPHLTVAGNIGYGAPRGLGRRAKRAQVAELLTHFELEALAKRYPGSLSGGEAQRVALARAIITAPKVLLLDEPLASLDPAARQAISGILRRLHREGQTIIHVTHDYQEAYSLASQVGVIEDHGLAQWGSPQEIFHHPKSAFIARFVGLRNFYAGRLEQGAKGGYAHFISHGLLFKLLTTASAASGAITFPGEAVSLYREQPAASTPNLFSGVLTDAFPTLVGIEALIDIGVEVGAILSLDTWQALGLGCGGRVWLSMKPEVIRFVEV